MTIGTIVTSVASVFGTWNAGTNDVVHLDPVASGDAPGWALQCLRTRLPQMLERAGAVDTA